MGIQKEGTVEGKELSKNGKPKIRIAGSWYFAGKTDIGSLQTGDRIAFTATSFGDRGNLWGIDEGFKLLEGGSRYAPAANGATPSLPTGGMASPASAAQKALKSGDPVHDMERPAISNWVAAAIAAGRIQSPVDIQDWVRYAKQALREDTTFEGDIP